MATRSKVSRHGARPTAGTGSGHAEAPRHWSAREKTPLLRAAKAVILMGVWVVQASSSRSPQLAPVWLVLDTGCDPRVCGLVCSGGRSRLRPCGFRSLVEFLLIGIRFSGTSSAWLSRNVGRVLVARPYVSAHHVLGGMPPRSSPFLVSARSPHQIVLSFSPPNLCQTSRLSCFLLHL